MKYYVDVEGRSFELDFVEDGERLQVHVDGRVLTIDLSQVSEPSLYSLLINNESHDVLAETHGDEYDLLIGAEMFHLTVQDEWTRRLANIQRKAQVDEGDLPVKAPMPGAVISVEVTEGQEIKRGQGLVILSAMKMENEIKSPRNGTVKSIAVQAGQTVELGRTLVTIG